jgi:3-oxoacyl-[acyl-carrier-protein] synthase-3
MDRSRQKDLRFISTGSALPSRVVTNDEIAPMLDLDPSYIERLFDVRERHWARDFATSEPAGGQRSSDLAVAAARQALDRAQLEVRDVDTLICVTSTPELITPALDYIVATKLGAKPRFSFTLHAACTGLFRAIEIADNLAAVGKLGVAVITTSEVVSPFFRLERELARCHRLSAALYADGAAAVVVAQADSGLARVAWHDHRSHLREEPPGIVFPGPFSAMGGVESVGNDSTFGYHNFRAVLDGGSELTARAARSALDACGWSEYDVRYFVTHQATGRIKRIAEQLGFPPERVPTNIARVGNTISASIPILLDELAPTINSGDRVVLFTAESATWSYGVIALEAA